MKTLSQKILTLKQKHQPNILVVGDLMLDHYIFGSASRLSPEAPVPIVHAKKETKFIGGAGNVAHNLIALGSRVNLAGIVGNDENGSEIITRLNAKNIQTAYIVKDDNRCTTLKTRVLAGNHQIVRIDREDNHSISEDLGIQIFEAISSEIAEADIIIISDYNKGLLTPVLTQRIIQYAKSIGKKVLVDPKGTDYRKYKDAYVIKPNRKELAETSKVENLSTDDKLKEAANIIFTETQVENLVVTLSEEGIVIITPSHFEKIPVKANEVFDVTGAGDTVIATMAYCLALGFSLHEACQIANYAATVVLKHVGSATTSIEEIINIMNSQNG